MLPPRYGIAKAQYPSVEFDTIYASIDLSGTPFHVDTTLINFNHDEGITTISEDLKVLDFFSSIDYPSYGAYDFQYGWEGDSLYLVAEATEGISDVEEINNPIVVNKFKLEQNYPNPFNPATTIRFNLPERSEVKLAVYNMLGQQVVELINSNTMTPGKNEIIWNGTNTNGRQVSSGVYIYYIEATSVSGNKFTMARRMVLLK
jgi:hypothetical protein